MNLEENANYKFGPFLLIVAQYRLFKDGAPISLTPKAFDTLLLLVRNSDRVVHKEELMEAVWGGVIVQENNINFCISQLRKILHDKATEPRYIITVRNYGYRFIEKVEAIPIDNSKLEIEVSSIEKKPERDELKWKWDDRKLSIISLGGAILSLVVAFASLFSSLYLYKDSKGQEPPHINKVIFLTPATPRKEFLLQIDGEGFNPKNVRVVITGPSCTRFGDCNVPNEALHASGNVSPILIEKVPLTLNTGDFQVFAQNGLDGTASNIQLFTVGE
jgi:DNA-binding winged helix-turn-helix (wHTH) protein